VLGNEHALARADPVWKALISNAKERKCLLNADEDLNIEQVIINVKTELDQLVDLLNKDSFIFEHTRWKVLLLRLSSKLLYCSFCVNLML